MRCLIDKSVQNADPYYRTYAREPSPAGDITMSPTDFKLVADMDLKAVLTEMKALGAKGELLVVTHSNPHGLKMPVVAGGNAAAAEMKIMNTLVQISSGISRREAIRSLSTDQKPKAWQNWFKDFDPDIKLDDGFEGNPGWEKTVEGFYTAWYERQGRQILKLPNPKQDLADLISLVDAVRKAGFARLEFRACRIGTDQDALKKVGEFFNTKKVVAPKEVRTFFGNISGVSIITDYRVCPESKSCECQKISQHQNTLSDYGNELPGFCYLRKRGPQFYQDVCQQRLYRRNQTLRYGRAGACRPSHNSREEACVSARGRVSLASWNLRCAASRRRYGRKAVNIRAGVARAASRCYSDFSASKRVTEYRSDSMSKNEEADLILKLYELRREETMRKARDWFFREFNPNSMEDITNALFSEHSGYLRMVMTYWDMAAALGEPRSHQH